MNPIGWCDITINPLVGCSKCSPGCDNCYAERFAARLAKNPATAKKYAGVVDENGKWTGRIRSTFTMDDGSPNYEGKVTYELFWSLGKKHKRVFIGSMTDIFHENADKKDLAHIMLSIHKHPQHTFMFLTKRPHVMKERLGPWLLDDAPSPNLWLGVTVCNQQEADEKIPVLLQIPAAMRFVSVEPMLGQMNIEKFLRGSYECGLSCGKRMSFRDLPEMRCTKCGFVGPDDETWGDGDCAVCPECGQDGCCGAIEAICPDCGHYMVRDHPDTPYIDWVICGGETGPDSRPMHPEWARSLRDQCQSAGVPFYFKGWGGWMPCDNGAYQGHIGTWVNGRFVDGIGDTLDSGSNMSRINAKVFGHNLLDGQEWHQFPEAL